MAYHKVKNGKLVPAGRFQVLVDSFYVKDMVGLKFHPEAKQKALESKRRGAIERGAQRAGRPPT